MSGAAEASGLSSAEPWSLCGRELGSGWAWTLIGNRPGLRAHKSRQDNLADTGVQGDMGTVGGTVGTVGGIIKQKNM